MRETGGSGSGGPAGEPTGATLKFSFHWINMARHPADVNLPVARGGRELNVEADTEIDLTVAFARLSSNATVGYVMIPRPLITTNTKFVNQWITRGDALSLAAHWMHEWMHVAGFYHITTDNNAVLRKDVAYSIGKIVVAVGRRLAGVRTLVAPESFDMGFGYLEATSEYACPVTEDDIPHEFMAVEADDSGALN